MIWAAVPGLPPSSNNAYITLRNGTRVLSPEGRKYKRETPAFFAQHFREEMLFFRKNVPLTLAVRFSFLGLTNKTWPEKAESRYKHFDTSNRLKLLEDALKDAAGIDDSQHMTVALQKCVGPAELTEIWAWDLEREESPFDRAFRGL